LLTDDKWPPDDWTDVNKRVLTATAVAATAVTASLLTPALSLPALASPARPPALSAAGLTCSASMTNSHPADYTSTGVKVGTAASADIETVAHYRTTTHRKYATASSSGRRTVWYYISGATPGYRVVVDVYVSRDGRKASCSTSFIPHR
jgi:hypothetical protein